MLSSRKMAVTLFVLLANPWVAKADPIPCSLDYDYVFPLQTPSPLKLWKAHIVFLAYPAQHLITNAKAYRKGFDAKGKLVDAWTETLGNGYMKDGAGYINVGSGTTYILKNKRIVYQASDGRPDLLSVTILRSSAVSCP